MWYSSYHVWILPIHESIVRLGVTKRMCSNLGEILHIDLPVLGNVCKEGEVLVVLESSKSAVEVLSPVSGKIIEVNQGLMEDIKLLNTSPEDLGWFVVVDLGRPLNTENLLAKD
ncbi:glycine cleavage protein H-like protein [Chlamydia avium]|uniref:Glycine cleavage system H-like protein n=1 Tax=Chlamydia avium 10DC88 TaxID=1229831 RepID=W8JQB1_9CHLA|nr:glycine cleavage protein H-like protein [Chlamydia avium]AHK63038.1 Glycine cleavage system H protein [Chlamydia avium 10DC88]